MQIWLLAVRWNSTFCHGKLLNPVLLLKCLKVLSLKFSEDIKWAFIFLNYNTKYHMRFQSWLIGWFLKVSKFCWFLWISHSTLFTACADQLLYSLSLIKWCSACAKQNTAVTTAVDACSLLAKQTFSDLVGKPACSLTL